MSLSRLPFTLRSSPIIRSFSSSVRRGYATDNTISTAGSPVAAPKAQQAGDTSATPNTHPADVVSGHVVGPVIERLSPGEITSETISGAPNALLHRQVRIYQPTKSTMQSAKGKTKRWVVDWDTLQGAGRWENPLMGWASSADYMQGTQMIFRTREDAVAFAEKQGWDYLVQEPKRGKIPPKNYASNYVHVPGKLRIHHTK